MFFVILRSVPRVVRCQRDPPGTEGRGRRPPWSSGFVPAEVEVGDSGTTRGRGKPSQSRSREGTGRIGVSVRRRVEVYPFPSPIVSSHSETGGLRVPRDLGRARLGTAEGVQHMMSLYVF